MDAVDAVDAVGYWYMVVGTLSLVQKGQTSGHSGIALYHGGNIVFGAKRSSQWIQWNSGIWMQYTVDAVDAVCSGRTTIYHYSTASTGLTFLH